MLKIWPWWSVRNEVQISFMIVLSWCHTESHHALTFWILNKRPADHAGVTPVTTQESSGISACIAASTANISNKHSILNTSFWPSKNTIFILDDQQFATNFIGQEAQLSILQQNTTLLPQNWHQKSCSAVQTLQRNENFAKLVLEICCEVSLVFLERKCKRNAWNHINMLVTLRHKQFPYSFASNFLEISRAKIRHICS